MKKILCSLFSAVLLSSGISVWAQQDLTIKKVSAENAAISMDGSADEPIWSQIEAIPIDKPFKQNETVIEEPSVTAYFKMFYQEDKTNSKYNYLYVYIDVTDDVLYPLWKNPDDVKNKHIYDKVEVYLDVNDVLNDGKSPAYVNGHMDKGHFQMAPDMDDEYGYGYVTYPSGLLYGSLSEQVGVAYQLKSDGTGYGIEFEFPLNAFTNDKDEALSIEAFQNLPQGMGFDVVIVDNDNDGKGRKRMAWKKNGPVEPYNNMDNCGVVRFGDEGGTVGIFETKKDISAVRVYPNPVVDLLTIEGDFDNVSIFNSLGQKVKSDSNSIVNMEDVVSGIYIVKTYKDGKCNGYTKVMKK